MSYTDLIILLFPFAHIWCHSYENIALNKATWQSSNYDDKQFLASVAVDGDTRQTYGSGSCAIIQKSTSGTWRVDLGKVLSVHHIKIFFRNDVNLWRFAGFFLYVSNTTNKEDGHLCYHELQTNAKPLSYIMTVNCIQHGRFVIFYNERNGPGVHYPSYYPGYLFNELCEVEVYGCTDPSVFGEDCNNTCPTTCKNQYCDIVSGTCFSCIDGYIGQYCEQPCADCVYGSQCRKTCERCLNGLTCNKVNGSCPAGCESGWRGETCDEVCPSGFYGDQCIQTCSTNCKDNVKFVCSHVTGKCSAGCKPGWEGDHCDKVCDGFFYGPQCQLRCGSCHDGKTCNHVSGVCPIICANGWQGSKCNITDGTDKITSEHSSNPQSSSANDILIAAIVGWVCCAIVSVFLIVHNIKHRKEGSPGGISISYSEYKA